MGTLTLNTNCTDLNAFQFYSIYKQKQAIEQSFKTYGDTMSYEASYVRNNYTEEAWLFLIHLPTIINAIEEIASIEESKNKSYKDLTQTLIKIKAGKMDEKWAVYSKQRKAFNGCVGNAVKSERPNRVKAIRRSNITTHSIPNTEIVTV